MDAKVLGHMDPVVLKQRVKRAKKIRYKKPLKVSLGPILKEALRSGRARSG